MPHIVLLLLFLNSYFGEVYSDIGSILHGLKNDLPIWLRVKQREKANKVSLLLFIEAEKRLTTYDDNQINELMSSIQEAAIKITNILKRFQMEREDPSSSETSDWLISTVNEVFLDALQESHTTWEIYSSQEKTNMIKVPDKHLGRFSVCFDALGGLKLLSGNIVFGSVFSIFSKSKRDSDGEDQNMLDPKDLCVSGYIIYGSCTTMVIAVGHDNGANGFTLDNNTGEFMLTNRLMKIPRQGSIYCINEQEEEDWDEITSEYIKEIKDPNISQLYTIFYNGTLAVDVHSVIMTGGIYISPPTTSKPDGKEPFFFGVLPLAHIMTEIGGKVTTGSGSVFEMGPTPMDQVCPIYMGSPKEMNRLFELQK